MNKILSIIIFSLLMISIKAQDIILTHDKYPELKYIGLTGKVYYNTYIQVKGSAYLSSDWQKGSITLENGEVLNDVSFKCDVYNHQLLVYNESIKRVILIDKYSIKGFSFIENGEERNFIRINDINTRAVSIDGNFVEVLSSGYISLYKLIYKNKIALSTPVMPFIDEFNDGVEYHLMIGSAEEQINLRKTLLIRKFPEYKADIKHYIRKTNLKVKHEKDFIRVIQYLNGIVAEGN
jgi:hypothetical protein